VSRDSEQPVRINNLRVNFAMKKHPVSSQQNVCHSQYKHSSPLEHSTRKSKHANDKLFSYLQEAYLWVKARDFCIHQLQRLQVKRGLLLWVDMHSKNYMNQLHSVRSIEQIRTRFTPNKWLQLFITCSTVSGEKRRGRVMLVTTQRGEAN